MKEANQAPEAKKIVSSTFFEKEVEKEYAFLTYLEYMGEKEALRKARQTISEKYEVAKKREANYQ